MTNINENLTNRPVVTAVLAMDIISYSKEFDELQVRLVSNLNEIVRAALDHVKPSRCFLLPTGDGVIVVLPGESSAVALDLAIRIHRLIREKLLRINVRMGIHEGQGIIVTDINQHENIAGNVVNLCQRVMDIGDADHILLSESAFFSLKNSERFAHHLFELKSNPVEVKHGLRLNIYSYYDGESGNPRIPAKVSSSVGIAAASIGRPPTWAPFVDTTHKLKIIGHCLRLPASPDFQDAMEVAILNRGTRVQILLLNTLSAAFEVRSPSKAYKSDSELRITFDYVFRSLVDFHKKLAVSGGEQAGKCFDVRLFDAIPTFAGFITDEKAYISMYLENTIGSMGPYFVCNRLPGAPSSLYESVERAFDAIWEDRAHSIFDPGFLEKQHDLIMRRRKACELLRIPQYQEPTSRSK